MDEIRLILTICSIDVLCICESWLDDSVTNNDVFVDGYVIVRKDRNRSGGGVLMFIKDSFDFETINCDTSDNVECIFVKIKSEESMVVGTAYRPPSAPVSYLNSLLDCIEQVKILGDIFILCGDLNFNCHVDLSAANNPILYIESAFNLKQLVNEHTRVTANSSSLIDVILSSLPDKHSITNVLKTTLSDHFMVYTVINTRIRSKVDHREVTYRDFKHFNATKFLCDLRSCPSFTMICNNINTFWNYFKEEFLAVCNKHAPLRTRRLKSRYCPWISPDIVKLMYTRDHAHKVAVRDGDSDLWLQYRTLRNKVTADIRKAKRDYFHSEFMQSDKNPRKTWNIIEKLTNSRVNQQKPPLDLKAEDFNNYFSSIGESTVKSLEDYSDEAVWSNPPPTTRFIFQEVTVPTTQKMLIELGNDSSTDVLGFDAKLLSLAYEIISPCLTKMFNLSLQTSELPDDWKLARVTPLYKGKGSQHDHNNYRPIAIIAHIAKICERNIQRQLMQYMIINEYINIDQSAYRAHHSTQTSILRVTDDFIDNMCDKLLTGVCLLDIKKCFDTISHKILKIKLGNYGIVDVELRWFDNYLSNRSQVVSLNGNVSSKSTINIGVPQGTVLAPLLFMIFVNDISQSVGLSCCNLYADDTLIYCSGSDVAQVTEKLQNSITCVSSWYKSNCLCLNIEKSNVLLVTNKNCHEGNVKLDIQIDNQFLNQSETADYLGVRLDSHLAWSAHVKKICSSLGYKINRLSRLKTFTPEYVLNKIYISSIQNVIDYGICSWAYSSSANIHKVQRLQHYAARIITGNFDYVNSRGADLVKTLGWMNVVQRRDYFTLLQFYKCVHGDAPVYLSDNITLCHEVNDVYNLRSNDSNDAVMPFPYNVAFKNSFKYHGALLWNSLPSQLKCFMSLNTFKCKLKAFIKASQ